jgi:alpha-1,2-mannosyltransferase
LRGILLNSKVYFHCAIDEHFGISVIEAMASGCVPIVHDSGGPKEIVPEKFRYKTIDDATEKIRNAIMDWSPEGAWELRNSTLKFSQENFSKEFFDVLYSHGLLRNAENE